MSDPEANDTSNTSHPRFFTSRAWGSFQYKSGSRRPPIRFTKEGREGHAGTLGYVFGRRPDCDVLINGTLVNGALIGFGSIVRLQHGDRITYVKEKGRDGQSVYGQEFTFTRGEPDTDLTFDSQFKIGSYLGTGNFATVHKAIDKKTGVEYAVKVVKKTTDFNTRTAQSLEREIGTLMSIDHPNLLRLHKVFSEDRYYYVVTELAKDGELFDNVKRRNNFTEPEARHVFRQLLNGVKYLHDRGIVHRDLKLENVLVMDRRNLDVKISDFGLANVIGESAFLSTVCGTPSYVAPEVIRKEKYGKAVDMWSLGVLLYIILCGFPPFTEDLAPPRLREQVLRNMYKFPSPYWDEVSEEAVDLIQELLLQDTSLRLTVDQALAHAWMHLEDDEGTLPAQARTETEPHIRALVNRIHSQRKEKAKHRTLSSNSANSVNSVQSFRTATPTGSVASQESLTALASQPLRHDSNGTDTLSAYGSDICEGDSYARQHDIATTTNSLVVTVASRDNSMVVDCHGNNEANEEGSYCTQEYDVNDHGTDNVHCSGVGSGSDQERPAIETSVSRIFSSSAETLVAPESADTGLADVASRKRRRA
ncbi:hypothetical protein BGZ99_002922 [Dissophora globulifera]|uniref:Protein kinase domain-containing protein n=1 Tax=Dissophora globulifera TaxID=979702 RepID=A0A9P6RLS4_9FUNG|nr:hypothetical protein BGZ99_002922 [Dissophora globulifera]